MSQTTTRTHIFLTGATGYIGGSVLTRLLNHKLSDTFEITVLVRNAEKAEKLKTLGVNAVIGSNEDIAILKRLATEADIVIASADADDLAAAQAILDGLKERYEKTGQVPSLLHTSGTGVVIDNARGMHSTDKVYSDLDDASIAAIDINQPHRIVDAAIVEADAKGDSISRYSLLSFIDDFTVLGYIKSYIILPSTIYGAASGTLVDIGVQNAYSQQIPALVKLSLQRGKAGIFGPGKNLWPNVHIDDVTDLYLLILEKILPNNGNSDSLVPGHGASGYYFGENGEHALYSVGKAIAQAMYDLGKTDTTEPVSFTEQEVRNFPPTLIMALGTNSRCKADRARSLGWKPTRTTEDMLSSIKDEVERLVGHKAK
ncbi:hypothetical protein JOM56_001160 [Amanita muscaria]